jgi:two-component system sensor kinase FixL
MIKKYRPALQYDQHFIWHSCTHRVLVRAELAAGLPPVHGDRVQLQQVILNLVINGIDAMAIARPDRAISLLKKGRGASAAK